MNKKLLELASEIGVVIRVFPRKIYNIYSKLDNSSGKEKFVGERKTFLNNKIDTKEKFEQHIKKRNITHWNWDEEKKKVYIIGYVYERKVSCKYAGKISVKKCNSLGANIFWDKKDPIFNTIKEVEEYLINLKNNKLW